MVRDSAKQRFCGAHGFRAVGRDLDQVFVDPVDQIRGGHDSVAAYRIGDDGRLSLIAIEPSLGKGPQNLAITPDGGWLLCANLPGNNVAVFRIDPRTGRLKAVGEPISQTGPSCIMLLP